MFISCFTCLCGRAEDRPAYRISIMEVQYPPSRHRAYMHIAKGLFRLEASASFAGVKYDSLVLEHMLVNRSIGRASLVIILRDVARFTPLLARLVQ